MGMYASAEAAAGFAVHTAAKWLQQAQQHPAQRRPHLHVHRLHALNVVKLDGQAAGRGRVGVERRSGSAPSNLGWVCRPCCIDYACCGRSSSRSHLY